MNDPLFDLEKQLFERDHGNVSNRVIDIQKSFNQMYHEDNKKRDLMAPHSTHILNKRNEQMKKIIS